MTRPNYIYKIETRWDKTARLIVRILAFAISATLLLWLFILACHSAYEDMKYLIDHP